jgi:hypothetical protein
LQAGARQRRLRELVVEVVAAERAIAAGGNDFKNPL